ncbi:hypothetical protein E4U09_005498 [Claviceps aff. purpurea]|uniref:Uncharacterized protein n=1 Tax=Claviceps aff. purpurea TaxID=1967640 RepID=A0A9P7TZW3_9HYPO|nr:hypothetical protein E4U09_005498 [Claviceps aff. purpurea]
MIYVHPEVLENVINKIGPNLKTLTLKIVPDADNPVLASIHKSCRSLQNLRISDHRKSETMRGQGFASLFRTSVFTDWANRPNPPLCGGPAEMPAWTCRAPNNVDNAFEQPFTEKAVYPELKTLEGSFCEQVNRGTDYMPGCIFGSCPKIKEVNVFGCIEVKNMRVPRVTGHDPRGC